jgi:N utilization substance protein A
MKGSRVQNVVQELQGERIDIVPWSPDPAKYVSNALAPAEVSMVIVDEEKKSLLVVVADDQLSLAIGRGGQNVRLASALLKWRIDVKSEQKYAKGMEEGYKSLVAVEGVNEKMADALYDEGVTSAKELAEAEPADIVSLDLAGGDLESVTGMIAAAQEIVEKTEEEERVAAVTAEQEADISKASPEDDIVAESEETDDSEEQE